MGFNSGFKGLIYYILYFDSSMLEVPIYLEIILHLAGKTSMHCKVLVHNASLQWIHPNSSTSNPWQQTHTHTHSCICCQTIHLSKLNAPVTQVSKVA